MNKNIVNPIAVAMLLLAVMPGIGSATTIRNKLVNTNLQLSRPKYRPIISLMLIVTLSAGVLISVMPFEAQAAGGAYTLTWRAADPSSYQKYTPATLACPGDAGRYADPLTNASSLDVVTSLAPSTLALGQIVPFEMIIGVNGNTSPENGVIQFTNKFATNTSSGDNFGYDPAYMVYCAFVDTADPGTIDPGNNATVDNFTSTLVGSGSNQYIQGTLNVSGLDNGDQVVVEIWVVLKSTIPPKSSGTVSATVDSAQTASGDTINSGKQSTDINKIGQFFTNKADVSVVKTDVPDPVMQGQTLNYIILVENHSPDTVANGIHVIDTLDTNTTFVSATGAPFTQNGNTLDFSVGFLTPGQNATLTINTIVADTAWANNDTSLTDPEQGSATFPTVYDLLNEVTETAITDDSNTTNNTYYQPTNVLSANAVLTITKTATPTTYSAVGDVITYNYQVTNYGNVVVTGLVVADNRTTVTLDKDTIAPGESAAGTASYTIKQSDIDAGWVTNAAIATGKYDNNKDVTSNEATATVTASQNAVLTITKTATPTTYSAVGEVITYNYQVTNDGNVVVTGLTVADNRTIVTLDKTELVPGESANGTASYIIAQNDIDAGWVTNSAVATGIYDGNKPVKSNDATATVNAIQNAALKIEKVANPMTYDTIGQTITYTYNVTNDGNVVVNELTVTDDKATVTLDKDTVAPGESVKGTASYIITQQDIDSGSVTNIASATGTYDGNKPVKSNEATATVNAVQNAVLTITKTATPTTYSAVGEVIAYTYTVTNDGNVVVNGLTVTDDKATVALDKDTIAPGESANGTASYIIVQNDIDAGSVTNVAYATGTYDGNKPVKSNDATATVKAEQSAALKLTKEASPLTYNAIDQTITYTYSITNYGNVVVTGLTVTDNRTTVTLDKTELAPGESATGTASYTIKQSDIDVGWVTNAAVATGKYDNNKDVTSNEATATVKAEQNAALTLTKEASPLTYNAVDQTITYTYSITNDGNVVVTGLTVADNRTTVTLDKDTIAPGESTIGKSTYIIKQEDIDAGWVTNSAVATGKYDDNKDVTSNEATATVTASQNAVLIITKTATPTTYSAVGDVITYNYKVTNDGNIVVTGLIVADNRTTVTLDKTELVPGESTKGTTTYTIKQEDIDAGWVTNSAVATGKYDDNKDVTSNEATATVKKVASTGQICPTQTTCDQYMSGTATDLTQANYLVNSKTKVIKSISPGVMFYYSTIEISAAGSVDISVAQSNNGTWPAIVIQDTKQVILYDSTCSKIAGTRVTTSTDKGSTVTLHADNLQPGTYYLGIKYSLSGLQGYKLITQTYPTVKYTFETMLNGNVISTSKDSIDLVPKPN